MIALYDDGAPSISEILGDGQLSKYSKLAYIAVASCQSIGTPKPTSLSTLAKYVGCSRPTVIKALDDLIRYGYIEKQSQKLPHTNAPASNEYRLLHREIRDTPPASR